MKAVFAGGAAALALALAGCGGGSGNNVAAAAANNAAPIPQIAAPNHGDWAEIATMTDRGSYLLGNPNAPVKLVEYASITCPHCAEFTATAATPLRERYVRSGQVSWEYRPYMIFPTDPGIFLLLHCLGPQPFFRIAEQLYADQPVWVGRVQALPQEQLQQLEGLAPAQKAAALVRAAGLDQFFRQRGLPEARMNTCLADSAALQQLQQISTRGNNEDGVQGTPTFIVNGDKLETSDWPDLEARLRTAIGG
jgi:protein-disulfide isomerase